MGTRSCSYVCDLVPTCTGSAFRSVRYSSPATPMAFIRLHFLQISALKHLALNPSRFFVTEAPPAKILEEEEFAATFTKQEKTSDVFKQWGFTENDISKIFKRLPSSRRMSLTLLQSKLQTLTDLGIPSSHLTKIITCRPGLLRRRIEGCWEQRLQFLRTLFGSNEVFLKAVIRNPSLLTYDLDDKIRPVIRIYENLGLSRSDLVSMLLVRPEMISRSSVGDEKLDLIRRTKVEKDSRMYKYVVASILLSRVETIREKVANLVKNGLQEDEVLQLFGRSPLVSTLSIDKVKRNMDFVIGTMKLSASVVLHNPNLLFLNLDTVIKPRFLLGEKIEDMGLLPKFKGPVVFTALRMTEKRYMEHFINRHPENVRDELLAFYRSAKSPLSETNAKCVRKLAEGSKWAFFC